MLSKMLVATYDESADGTEGSNALARAMVELDLDEVLLGLFLVLVITL